MKINKIQFFFTDSGEFLNLQSNFCNLQKDIQAKSKPIKYDLLEFKFFKYSIREDLFQYLFLLGGTIILGFVFFSK